MLQHVAYYHVDSSLIFIIIIYVLTILLTKTTAARNGVALSYHRLRGLYFLAVVFVRSIDHLVYNYIIVYISIIVADCIY